MGLEDLEIRKRGETIQTTNLESVNVTKDQYINEYLQGFLPRDGTDYISSEIKEEEDSLALKIVGMHQYKTREIL